MTTHRLEVKFLDGYPNSLYLYIFCCIVIIVLTLKLLPVLSISFLNLLSFCIKISHRVFVAISVRSTDDLSCFGGSLRRCLSACIFAKIEFLVF